MNYIRYECLPEKFSERFINYNVSTNKPIWNALFRLKAGVSSKSLNKNIFKITKNIIRSFELCTMAPGPYLLDHERFQDFDFLHTMIFRPNTMLIPEPSLYFGGITSVLRPFQTMVGYSIYIRQRSLLIDFFPSRFGHYW